MASTTLGGKLDFLTRNRLKKMQRITWAVRPIGLWKLRLWILLKKSSPT